jgi:hypothetical protein
MGTLPTFKQSALNGGISPKAGILSGICLRRPEAQVLTHGNPGMGCSQNNLATYMTRLVGELGFVDKGYPEFD